MPSTSDLTLAAAARDYLRNYPEDEKYFIVTTYQKLSYMRTGNETQLNILENIRRNINIIVADEAHMSPADTFSSSINFLDSIDETTIIGLTATPGRGIKHSQNEELANFFGQYKISITDENRRFPPLNPLKKLYSVNNGLVKSEYISRYFLLSFLILFIVISKKLF